MAHMHTRIPSWLHMPGLGLPVVASWGDNAFTAAAVQAADMERVRRRGGGGVGRKGNTSKGRRLEGSEECRRRGASGRTHRGRPASAATHICVCVCVCVCPFPLLYQQ